MAWEIQYGKIPDNLFVCHHCDNKRCCNHKHLFLGTDADNQHDRWQKHDRAIAKLVIEKTNEEPLETKHLRPVFSRLFATDVAEIKRIAADRGIPWQIELRLLIRRAIRGAAREVVLVKEPR